MIKDALGAPVASCARLQATEEEDQAVALEVVRLVNTRARMAAAITTLLDEAVAGGSAQGVTEQARRAQLAEQDAALKDKLRPLLSLANVFRDADRRSEYTALLSLHARTSDFDAMHEAFKALQTLLGE